MDKAVIIDEVPDLQRAYLDALSLKHLTGFTVDEAIELIKRDIESRAATPREAKEMLARKVACILLGDSDDG